jgi:flagellar assembly protein FliH
VARLSASIPDREMKAHAAGMAEGARQAEAAALERARREARQEYEQALESAAAAARQVLETRRAMRRQMEEDVAHLAVSVARRILHRELHVDPEALVGVVKSVVERIDARQVHRLCAAPYDLPFLKGHFASLGLPDRVEVVADPGLKRGSLVLETSRGHLDSSIETQLQEIDRGFADLVRRTT